MTAENDRIDELEIQLAHQARVIEDLSDVIHQQGQALARTERRLEAVIGRLREAEDPGSAPAADQKPPHW